MSARDEQTNTQERDIDDEEEGDVLEDDGSVCPFCNSSTLSGCEHWISYEYGEGFGDTAVLSPLWAVYGASSETDAGAEAPNDRPPRETLSALAQHLLDYAESDFDSDLGTQSGFVEGLPNMEAQDYSWEGSGWSGGGIDYFHPDLPALQAALEAAEREAIAWLHYGRPRTGADAKESS